MRLKIARFLLMFWCLFVGLGAVVGSIGMFVALDRSGYGNGSPTSIFSSTTVC